MNSKSVARSVVVCCLGVVVGCSGGSGDGLGTPVVRDSAGIRIVESTVPRWADGRGWVLASEPSVTIGGLREEPGHDLGSYDASLRRISVFDVNGVFHRSFNLPTPDGRVIHAADVLGDGSLIVSALAFAFDPSRRGLIPLERPLYRYRPVERSLDSLGIMLVTYLYWQPYRLENQGSLPIPVPFTRSAEYEAWHDRLLTADTDCFEILVHNWDGRLHSIFRKAHRSAAVTNDDIDTAYDLLYNRSSRDFIRKAVAAAFREFEFATTMPATGRWAWERVQSQRPALRGLEVDDVGNVWGLEYNRPGDHQRRWTVFDSEGVLLGTVPFPIGFDPLHIGDDFVLGWRLGELDEISVELYGLEKREP